MAHWLRRSRFNSHHQMEATTLCISSSGDLMPSTDRLGHCKYAHKHTSKIPTPNLKKGKKEEGKKKGRRLEIT